MCTKTLPGSSLALSTRNEPPRAKTFPFEVIAQHRGCLAATRLREGAKITQDVGEPGFSNRGLDGTAEAISLVPDPVERQSGGHRYIIADRALPLRPDTGESVHPSLGPAYDLGVRNTKAFKEAVAKTLAELAHRGVTLAPTTVADSIETQINTVSERLGIQVRSAWRYFDAAVTADRLAESLRSYEESSSEKEVGQAPMPPLDNPELALVLAGVPDSLAQTGGDLYAVIINVAVNAWMAGHIHGEDGCTGCEGGRGDVAHDWEARMRTITEMQPNIRRWFDRDVWTAAVNDSGYTVTRR